MSADLSTARRVPKEEFDLATSLLTAAQLESDMLLRQAREQTEELSSELRAILALQKELHQDEKEGDLRDAVDRQTALRLSQEAVKLVDAAAQVHDEFERLTPWLCRLVDLSLQKILGQREEHDVIAAAIDQAAKELKTKSILTVRVGPEDISALQAIIENDPARFVGIENICLDRNLSSGEVHLESEGSFVDVSVTTQLRALISHLTNSSVANNHAGAK